MVILQTFVSRTKTGKSMRAVAEDQEIASLMGIDVDRIVVTTFVIGGILAGIAGVLFALTFEQVNFFMGFRPGIAAFTAAVLGGIGSIGGAALGGFLLGLLQSVGPALLLTGIGVPSPFQLKDVVTFAVLVLVLIFRPGGLLRRRRIGEGLMPVGRLLRTGLVGGIAVIYVALVGLLAKIAEINLIGTQVTGARAVLLFVPFLVAYIAVRPRVVAGEIVTATDQERGDVRGDRRARGRVGRRDRAAVHELVRRGPRRRDLHPGQPGAAGDPVVRQERDGRRRDPHRGTASWPERPAARSARWRCRVRRPLATATAVTLSRRTPAADHPDRAGAARDHGGLALQSRHGRPHLARGGAVLRRIVVVISWGWTRRGKAASATVPHDGS